MSSRRRDPKDNTGRRDRSGRLDEQQASRSRSRPREASQVSSSFPSSGPSQLPGSSRQREVGGVRRRQTASSGYFQSEEPAGAPTRQREISQVSVSSGAYRLPTSQVSGRRQHEAGGRRTMDWIHSRQPEERNVQPPRRPREISEVSIYIMPTGPPQVRVGRRPRNSGAARTREFSGVSENIPYYTPVRPTQFPQGRGPPQNQYVGPPLQEYSYGSAPYPYYAQPTRPSQLPPNQYVAPPQALQEYSYGSAPYPYYAQPTRPSQLPPNQYVAPPRRQRAYSYGPAPYPYYHPTRPPQLPPNQYVGPPQRQREYGSAPYPYYAQPRRPSQLPGYGPDWDGVVSNKSPQPYFHQPSPYEQTQFDLSRASPFQYEDEPEADELSFQYPPETFTGFRELPFGKAFLILLFWLPRFFIPWITAWHDFNIFILSNPYHWEARNDELEQQNTYTIAGRSTIAILCSVFVDLIRTKCEMEYYVYFVLLVLFTLSPVAGGYLDLLLRAQFVDAQDYQDRWFTTVVLTRWAISFAFIMFPVQMACIYSQTNAMSRNAHYNWTSLFVLLESINAYVAFLIIPGACPTQDWTQIAVWAGIGMLLVTVTMLTLIFLFVVRALKYAMVGCCGRDKEYELDEWDPPDPFGDYPFKVQWKKLRWFCMIVLSITAINFTVAVLERFVFYEDWDQHHFSSALSIFLFSKIVGVMLMVLVMLLVRKACTKNKSNLRTECVYLGVPHVLCVLALVTMAGRLTSLSRLSVGDIVVGPIPDEKKTVLVFVNSMFRNRTICIRSEHFRPVKIRPYQHVTRELYDIGVDNFTVTMEVDPCSNPGIRTRSQIENIKKGEWKIYDVTLLSMNYSELDAWDYYRTLYAFSLRDEGDLRPKVGAPQLVIFQVSLLAPQKQWYYQMNHSTLGSRAVPTNNSVYSNIGFGRNLILWEVPATGRWTVKLWSNLFNKSDATYAWVTNCTQCVSPLEFEVDNNSLYLMVEYYYEEIKDYALNLSFFDYPPPNMQFPMYPLGYVIFKLAEVAGSNSTRLPDSEELQKDWAVIVSMALAGMASGGTFPGFVYLFWVDPPAPRFSTITLAVCWVFMGFAAEIPRLALIDVSLKVLTVLLYLQVLTTALHFVGAYFMHVPEYDFRERPN